MAKRHSLLACFRDVLEVLFKVRNIIVIIIVVVAAGSTAVHHALERAKVVLARKLGVVLHRMWMDATDFRWGPSQMAA